MRVQDEPPIHLTYCLNIHPGETWAENFAAIREKALKVKAMVAPRQPFGLGLRLSAQAAGELAQPALLDGLKSFLRANGLYAFTINGFPYGRFHGAPVKDQVYAPDWRTPERRDYTCGLADILGRILPEGVCGSISTIPGSYKAWVKSERDVAQMCRMLGDVAVHLHRIMETTGRDICLALEPEPDCFIETTAEAVAFFEEWLDRHGAAHIAHQAGLRTSQARRIIRRHVGICFDTAHAAVQFEDLPASLRALRKAGIRVAKIQLSSALRLAQSPRNIKQLARFLDETYLHQVRAYSPSSARTYCYGDLPQALTAHLVPWPKDVELRVHFHVPLFFEKHQGLSSTSFLLNDDFRALVLDGITEHLEIETYTFNILPKFLRTTDVTESIAREYQWVLRHLLKLVPHTDRKGTGLQGLNGFEGLE
jgi:sugar phosphate isomerase/epimerase